MKTALITLALLAAASTASAADSSVAGPWRVSGDVGGFKFQLRCTFAQAGAKLTGACVDLATNNAKAPPKTTPHTLTQGSSAGGRVSFAYQSSFLMNRFDVAYSGTLSGDRIAGTILAGGRKGVFTATRD